MKKRQFLSSSIGVGVAALTLPSSSFANHQRGSNDAPILTITGAIARTNRHGFDATRDILMAKQKLSFEKAYTVDFAIIKKLPTVSINPVLEYDGKRHTLQGPLLTDVLQLCGLAGNLNDASRKVLLRAIDGYAVTLSMEQVRKFGLILATKFDGQAMALGGLGPLWAVFDVEKQPELAAKPLAERFASCPWATYHIDIA